MVPMGSLEARRFFCCVVCSIRTAAPLHGSESVSAMRTIYCPDMCGKFTSNYG